MEEAPLSDKIVKALREGWQHGGIEWRKQFVDKGLNPDTFLELPNAEEMLTQYQQLPESAKTQFLNTLYRRYEFLRN